MTANSLLKNLLHIKGATVDTLKAVEELKNSKYALGKNEQNLTERQRERLSMIQSEDGPLARGHRLKERLKAVFALKDPDLAEEYSEAPSTAGSQRSWSSSGRSDGIGDTSSTRSGSD